MAAMHTSPQAPNLAKAKDAWRDCCLRLWRTLENCQSPPDAEGSETRNWPSEQGPQVQKLGTWTRRVRRDVPSAIQRS